MSRAGYVLVGGRSSRMGRDKAFLPHGGGALAQAVAHVVRRAAGSATLVGDPRRYASLGFPVVADAHGQEGPLGGILTALSHTGSDWNLITACDMPRLTSGALLALLEQAERLNANALVPFGPGGGCEPVCAVYHRRARVALEAAFGRGVRRAAAAAEACGATLAQIADLSVFQSVNTPEEWAAYEP